MRGLDTSINGEQLREVRLFSLEQKRLKCDLMKRLFTVLSNTGTGFLERWSMLCACQCSGGRWIMPSVTCCSFWLALKRSGLGGLCRSLPTELFEFWGGCILFFKRHFLTIISRYLLPHKDFLHFELNRKARLLTRHLLSCHTDLV